MLNIPNDHDKNNQNSSENHQFIIEETQEQPENNTESLNNLYAKNYNEQEQIEELEQNAPVLNNPVDRNINKKALAFLGLTSIGVFGMALFAWQQMQEPEEQPKPVEQMVSIPEPDLPPLPPEPAPQPTVAASTASSPEVPPIVVQPTPKREVVPVETVPVVEPVQPTPPVQPTETYRQPERIETVAIEQPQVDPLDEMRKAAPLEESTVPDNGVGQAMATTAPSAAKLLPNRDKLLIQGTYLRCVLETKIVSDISGFTSCVITEPVYSASGKYLLIPKGSKVLGQYGSSNPTSERFGVIWDRLITPDGVDITLKSPGVDNLGAAGHVGKFQSHWGSRLGSALLISLISDAFKYAGAEHGSQGTTETTNSSTITNPYESETANTLKQQAINQLERNNMRPNTVTINQGSLINIYTAQDIDFSGVVY